MYRILMLAIASLLYLAGPVFGSEFEVIQVDIESQQAILQFPDTGEQRILGIGEEMEGWRIVKIESGSVTMFHRPQEEGMPALARTVPLKGARSIIQVSRKLGD